MNNKFILLLLGLVSPLVSQAKEEALSEDLSQAIECFNKGDSECAMAKVSAELKNNPENARAHFMLSTLYFYDDNVEDAMGSVNSAIKYAGKRNEMLPSLYGTRASYFLTLGDTTAALKDYETALKHDRYALDVLLDRATLYAKQYKYNLSDEDYATVVLRDKYNVKGYIGLGRNSMSRKNYDDAIAFYNNAVNSAPNYPLVYSLRSKAYLASGKYDKATQDVIYLLTLPNSAVAGIKPREILKAIASKDFNEVAFQLSVKAKQDTANMFWYNLLGSMYLTNCMPCEGIENFVNANKTKERYSNYVYIGDCYTMLGDFENARKMYVKARDLAPERKENYLAVAESYRREGNVSRAIELIDSYIKMFPEDKFAYSSRAECKYAAKDYEGALEDITNYISAYPKPFFELSMRADIYKKLGKDGLLKSDCEEIIKLDTAPGNKSYAMFAYASLGQTDKAKEFMQKVLDSDNVTAVDYYNAACLYGRMGEREQGLKYLRMCFEKKYSRFGRITVDYDMDVYRDMPEFDALIKEFRPVKNKYVLDLDKTLK